MRRGLLAAVILALPSGLAAAPPATDREVVAFLRRVEIGKRLHQEAIDLESEERADAAAVLGPHLVHGSGPVQATAKEILTRLYGGDGTRAIASQAGGSAAPTTAWEADWAAWAKQWGGKWAGVMKKAAKARRFDLAYRFADAAVQRQEDQKDARKRLGHAEHAGEWLPGWRAKKRRAGLVWDDRCGWVRQADRARLDEGLLPQGKKWLPADQVLEFHHDWRHPWEHEWGPWIVMTDGDPTVARAAAEWADRIYAIVRREFGGSYPDEPIKPVRLRIYTDSDAYDAHVHSAHSDDLSQLEGHGFYDRDDRSVHVRWNPTRVAHRAEQVCATVSLMLLREIGYPRNRGANWIGKGDWIPDIGMWWAPVCSAELAEEYLGNGETTWTAISADLAKLASRPGLWAMFNEKDGTGVHSDGHHAVGRPVTTARFFRSREDRRYREAYPEFIWLIYSGRCKPTDLGLFAKLAGRSWDDIEGDWTAFLDGWKSR